VAAVASELEFFTPQELARTLKISTYTAYELIKRGEIQAVRVGRQLRVPRSALVRYLREVQARQPQLPRAEAASRLASRGLVPGTPPEAEQRLHGPLTLVGSHDPALELLISELRKQQPGIPVSTTFTGSLTGLMALFQRQALIAAAHLWEEKGPSRRDYLRHLLPHQHLTVVRLCLRRVGLATAPGNPKGIREVADLARPEVRFVNRQRGSGTRVRLERLLAAAGIEPQSICGYEDELETHHAVAAANSSGQADVGLVCEMAAAAIGLHFIPLYREPYDLVLLRENESHPYVAALLTVLQSAQFRARVSGLSGYELDQLGKRWELRT